ncbi:hypothetical protein HNV11_10005 [Spirosoma taeanense]|uniref:DUF4276 family protein n=1 Tax=Spirosoma taeanense TaxID=2735870 RepID=A0A6M5Y8V5_9BACT|nr:hypothetical protein [Spirosoma taeanense]QJW89690.1 hypothetical protein HNV11_10005 [Spirosoma taeanense]
MVNVGFICEGDTEVKIVKSEAFQTLLAAAGLHCVSPIQNADGNGNLLPHNIEEKRQALLQAGTAHVVVLTDQDDDTSVEATRQRIGEYPNQHTVIAVRAAEAWFLADSATMSTMLDVTFHMDYPEQEADPFETIRQLFLAKTGRGVGTKPILARRMLKYGFSIERAAAHPNCPSAHYFLTKLQTLASAN